MQHKEFNEQKELLKWARAATYQYPDLAFLHCSLNGVKLSKLQAMFAKQSGMLAGVPDLFLPTKRGEYSGIFIEMKFGTNVPTEPQKTFLEYVSKQGFKAIICYSWFEAKNALEEYLKL